MPNGREVRRLHKVVQSSAPQRPSRSTNCCGCPTMAFATSWLQENSARWLPPVGGTGRSAANSRAGWLATCSKRSSAVSSLPRRASCWLATPIRFGAGHCVHSPRSASGDRAGGGVLARGARSGGRGGLAQRHLGRNRRQGQDVAGRRLTNGLGREPQVAQRHGLSVGDGHQGLDRGRPARRPGRGARLSVSPCAIFSKPDHLTSVASSAE